MRPNKVYLSQLTTSSRNYRVKVRVIEKGRPKCSPKKGTLYQNLLLEDEQGSRMRGTLFGEQVEGYKEVLMYNGEYEIANAPIKPCEEQWKLPTSGLDYQMHFGRPAIVECIKTDKGPLLPQYQSIAQIPKTADPNDKYDIAAVVLFVEDKPRKIPRDQDRVIAVREITVIDHSTEQPLIISAWNDLADDECDLLMQKTEQLQVVGFTALKVSPHKGFSLTTTMSTTILHSAVGDRPRALEDWAASHKAKLCEIQARVLFVKGQIAEQQNTTIAALRTKKAHNTLQDEKYTLQVTIPEPDFDKINAYLGCSNCNKRTNIAAGITFSCPYCQKPETKSIPRITFTCEVSDGTDTLPITAFTTNAEKIFHMLAPDIFKMKHSEDNPRFELLKTKLQTSPTTIEVAPNTTLSMNNVLHWVLKKVVEQGKEPPNTPATETQATQTPSHNTPAGTSEQPINNTTMQTSTDNMKTADTSTITNPQLKTQDLISVKIEGSKSAAAKKGTNKPTAPSKQKAAALQNHDTLAA